MQTKGVGDKALKGACNIIGASVIMWSWIYKTNVVYGTSVCVYMCEELAKGLGCES